MSENNGNSSDEDDLKSNTNNDSKPSFGSLKPLTAIQIIGLLVPSSPVSAGACY